jgi:hypothetical protein
VRRLIPESKAALGLAGFLALPVFFASLMAATLAIEKARVVEWKTHRGIARIWHNPIGSTEAKIWLLALIPPLLLVAVGWIAAHFPYALYVTCASACIDALALTIRLHRWEMHHTARFAYGEDLLADQTTSSSLQRGEWEHDAAQTVWSLVHYTIGLALAGALIAAFFTFRRRRGKHAPPPPPPLELVTGGAPPTSA